MEEKDPVLDELENEFKQKVSVVRKRMYTLPLKIVLFCVVVGVFSAQFGEIGELPSSYSEQYARLQIGVRTGLQLSLPGLLIGLFWLTVAYYRDYTNFKKRLYEHTLQKFQSLPKR